MCERERERERERAKLKAKVKGARLAKNTSLNGQAANLELLI